MDSNPKKPSKWLSLIGIASQMGVIIFLFARLGLWLDEHHPSSRVYYYKLLGMVGVVLALYNVFRQLNDINKSN